MDDYRNIYSINKVRGEGVDYDFFHMLRKHSQAKLEILTNYIVPWMRKITLGRHNGKCLIIDGFAGTGRYDDESDGSPLLLLHHAIEFCEQARANGWKEPEIYIILIEGDTQNFDMLRQALKDTQGFVSQQGEMFTDLHGHPSIHVACLNATFESVLSMILDDVSDLIPSFCFVDPYGFSATPIDLIWRYLQNPNAEVLLNFIYEETNRFLKFSQPKIEEHFERHFGVENLREIRALVGNNTGKVRRDVIVEFYANQLRKGGAKHILTFDIKKQGRTKLILFYATKHKEGLNLMKQAMFKVDDTGAYLFDDRYSSEGFLFEILQELTDSEAYNDLANLIYKKFKGTTITNSVVEDFVIYETIYPREKYMTNSLRLLEGDGRISSVKKRNGTKRRNGYKDVYISFI